MTESLISTGAAATMLGVSRQHIVNLCDRGELPHVFVGAHRRIRPGDLARTDRTLTLDEERSLWLHEAVLGLLVLDPERVLGCARTNLRCWQGVHRSEGMTDHYLKRWGEILDRGMAEIRQTLIGTDHESVELRQNSPFAGVLTDSQRRAVLRNFTTYVEQSGATVEG